MISPNHTEPVEKQSVILSREITKLEDVYSFTEVVQEKLSLHVSLTLILFGDDSDSNFESNLVKSETDDFEREKESLDIEDIHIHQSEPVADNDSESVDEAQDDPRSEPDIKQKIKIIKFKKVDKEFRHLWGNLSFLW